MVNAETEAPCRVYIVYHHGLFAQGVRSVLETRNAARVVGMETNMTKALKAMRSLKPEVIIVEERAGQHQPIRVGALLNSSDGGRVVTLSLDHGIATMYQRNRMSAKDPADLINTIRGVGKHAIPTPDHAAQKAAMLVKPAPGANGNRGRPGSTARAALARRKDATKA